MTHPSLREGRRALVMGLGDFGGGGGAARYLADQGLDVTVTDLRTRDALRRGLEAIEDLHVRLVLGEHRDVDFERADIVVANPAVRPDHPQLQRARSRGAVVTSEIELFLQAVRARIVAVTGTQGKSSTCHVLASLLSGCGARAHLGGNIGGSLLGELPRIAATDVVVLELSSYQLAALNDPRRLARSIERVEAVCITNVLADHLERHGSVRAYAEAKARILDLLAPGGTALIPATCSALEPVLPTPRAEARRVRFAPENPESPDGADERHAAELTIVDGAFRRGDVELARVEELALRGDFQRANALCALGMAHALGIEASALAAALPGVHGLPHRLELVGTYGRRRVHDNGVSTTPDSTVSALRSLPRGVHWILGGRLKDLPLGELASTAAERVARAVCFGEAGATLAGVLADAGVDVTSTATVEEATANALAHAPAGADVLFSPACASFDAYPNFRARALDFRAAVERHGRTSS